jgi:hypothetical protein
LAAQAGGLQPPAASADAFHHDAALVAWVDSRRHGSPIRAAHDEEPFIIDALNDDANEAPFGAVDIVFDDLSAWAA